MDPKTQEYLASRLADRRTGRSEVRVLGLTDKVRTCDHCGKTNLTKTVVVQVPDGRVLHLGTDCAEQIRRSRGALPVGGAGAASAGSDGAGSGSLPPKDPVVHFEHVPTWVEAEVPDAARRAISAGAREPLGYIGAGMSGIVFCDARGVGWKVGRSPLRSRSSLRQEAEWLFDAAQVPFVRDHVARIRAFHEDEVVIERECVQGDPLGWVQSDRAWALHEEIRKRMLPFGWGAPEFKVDSYVMTRDRGLVLVDAGMAIKVGRRLVEEVEGLMSGALQPRLYEDRPSDYRFAVRAEVMKGTVDRQTGEAILAKLEGCDRFPCEGAGEGVGNDDDGYDGYDEEGGADGQGW